MSVTARDHALRGADISGTTVGDYNRANFDLIRAVEDRPGIGVADLVTLARPRRSG